MLRPSLDELRALRPDLTFALYAMEAGADVTLEIYSDGHVYPFKGATVADAILEAFPPDRPVVTEPEPATPDNIFD